MSLLPSEPVGGGPMLAPVPTAPVAPAAPHRTRARWLVAGGLTAVLAIVVIAIVVLAGQRASVGSAAPGYLPSSTLAYVDARLDLPGDQGQQLAGFLSKFPGFADQAALPAKLDDVMTRLIRSASQGTVDWDSQIKPWFGGQVAMGVIGLPPAGSAQPRPDVLYLVTVSDPAAARSSVATILKDVGATVASSETYRGTLVEVISDPAHAGDQGALAVTPEMLIAGTTTADVKSALDLHAGQGTTLAASGTFSGALANLRRDRLGTVYLDVPALTRLAQTAAAAGPQASLLAAIPRPVGVVAGGLHAEGDRLVVTFRAAKGPDAPNLSARTGDLTSHVPAAAVAYVEVHDAGQAFHDVVARLETLPGVKDQLNGAQLQAIEGLLGGDPQDLRRSVKDAGFAVTLGQGGGLQAGIVASAGDTGVAQARLSQWLALLKLAALQSNGAISTTEEQDGGTTITIIHIAAQGAQPGAGGTIGLGGPYDIAVAQRDDLVVVGLGDAFVKQILATTQPDSLASATRFQTALAAAGGPRDAGLTWLDLAALKAPLEAALPAGDRTRYETDVAPYVAVLDHLIVVQSVDGSTFTSVIQLATH